MESKLDPAGDRKLPARDGSINSPPILASDHRDAAFYHESAAFHHRQAALHLEHGDHPDAERHIWAAFGHSLNAHESTRSSVSALRDHAAAQDGDGARPPVFPPDNRPSPGKPDRN